MALTGRSLRAPLGLALLASCGACVSVEALITAGRLGDACREIEGGGDFYWKMDMRDALRAGSDTVLEIRALSRAEAERALDVPLPASYGATRLLLQLTLQGTRPEEVSIESVQPGPRPAADAHWVNYVSPAEEAVLFPPIPPPPAGRHVPPGLDTSGAQSLLGVVGVFTGVTPFLSVLSGRDLVTGLLNARPPQGRTEPPTDDERRRYEQDPRVVAARELRRRFEGKTDPHAQRCRLGPGRRCELLSFVTTSRDRAWDRGAPPPLQSAAPATWLSFYVVYSFPAPAGAEAKDCKTASAVQVRLRGGGTLEENINRSLHGLQLPLARLPRMQRALIMAAPGATPVPAP